MTTEEIKKELQKRIGELEMFSKVQTLEEINWINDLIKKMDVKPVEKKVETKVKVEIEEEKEEKPAKRKITFKKK